MRIRRRGTDAPPHGQAAPSTQTRSPPAPSPTSARHSGTTARSAETPSREANPSMWEETPFRHAQPSRGCRKSQVRRSIRLADLPACFCRRGRNPGGISFLFNSTSPLRRNDPASSPWLSRTIFSLPMEYCSSSVGSEVASRRTPSAKFDFGSAGGFLPTLFATPSKHESLSLYSRRFLGPSSRWMWLQDSCHVFISLRMLTRSMPCVASNTGDFSCRKKRRRERVIRPLRARRHGKKTGDQNRNTGGAALYTLIAGTYLTGEVPKGEDEERRREVDEKASEDPTRANVSVAICRKGDGKGWHCKRPAQMGYSLCQYHLDKLRSYGSRSRKRKPQAGASPPEKPAAAGIQRQGATQLRRTKRRRMEEHVSSGTGTGLGDSFYYYSGFGPRWGKRRADRSGDVVKLPGDGGASDHVHPLDDAGDAAPAAVKDEEEEEEEDEYEWPSRDGKPWKSRPLSSLL